MSIIKIWKEIGETPLECMERYRKNEGILEDVPMTYAGRLDPLAEGELLVLTGEDVKQKEKYLGLDKEYEIEVLFGFETDTYDVLGIVEKTKFNLMKEVNLKNFVGKFSQEYPPFSSRTVNGVPLFVHAKEGRLNEIQIPKKEIEIYKIENLGVTEISRQSLEKKIFEMIDLVQGDFRQSEIRESWLEKFSDISFDELFPILKLRVQCSSGTYMRTLAHMIGKSAGVPALALSIKRTKILF